MPSREFDVLVLGPYPPPSGGVSSHVQRMCGLLSRRGVRVGVLNHFRSSLEAPEVIGTLARSPLRYWWLTGRTRSQVVHYHHSGTAELLAVALRAWRDERRYVVTFHGARIRSAIGSRVPLRRAPVAWALRQFDHVIVVNRELAEDVARIVPHDRVTVMPAFVPPDPEDARAFALDAEARGFVTAGDPTLVVSASKVRPVSPSGDLWGLDVAVDGFVALRARHDRLRLALFVSVPPGTSRERRYFETVLRRVRDAGLDDRVLVRFDRPLLGALLSNTVFVRPTRTDGDAVSLREALALGVPTVASDAVRRPSGVTTFRSGDPAALAVSIERVLEGDRPGPYLEHDVDHLAAQMLSIYRLPSGNGQ